MTLVGVVFVVVLSMFLLRITLREKEEDGQIQKVGMLYELPQAVAYASSQ